MISLRTVWYVSGLMVCLPVYAGRPMATDDAGITEAGACQLESWAQRNQGFNEYWAVPACNFTGNLEVAIGRSRAKSDSGHELASMIQGKTLFKPLRTNGWGIGLAFGTRFQKGNLNDGDHYAYMPASWSFADDRLIIHSNIGWLREKANRRNALTWALGTESALTAETSVSVEAFGQDIGKPSWQVGARHWIMTDRVQVDMTYGNRFGQLRGEQRWFSVGLKFVTAPLW